MKKSATLLSLTILASSTIMPSMVLASEIKQPMSTSSTQESTTSQTNQSSLSTPISQTISSISERSSASPDSIKETTTEAPSANTTSSIKTTTASAPTSTSSQETNSDYIKSGTWGTVPWTLFGDGTLTLGTGTGSNGVPPFYDSRITKINFSGKVIAPEDCSHLFSLSSTTEIDNFSNFDTSKVTNMDSMFASCKSLTSLDLSSFDTSNVTNMDDMFGGCESLTSLDLSSFDTSNVTNMDDMFGGCDSLTSLDLSSFDTSKVTNMDSMFVGCDSLTSLDLSSFDTSNVTNMDNMFGYCESLTSLDLSSFDTSNVTNMDSMFNDCDSLTSLDLSSFDTSKVTNMNTMFYDCTSLTSLDLSSFDTSKVTNMEAMFFYDTLHVLSLGKLTKLSDNVSLNEAESSSSYTGKWQTIGNGTVDKPTGNWVGKASDLYAQSSLGVADTYVWQPKAVAGADVTAKYVDTDGNSISKDVVFSGNIGETYTTVQKDIDGYTFKEVKGNPTGTFSDKAQTVTYVYTKNPVAGADVTAKYVDTDGNSISKDVVFSGNIGETYTTVQKDIDGYTFKEVQGNPTGTFSDKAQTVTYVYTKNKSNPVNPKLKSENNDINNNHGTTSSARHGLPETGENERMTIMSIILGLILVALAAVVSIFRFKKANK